MKQKIVAIGGGDIRKNETLKIDTEIIKLSGKKQPKMLFIPTASSDNAGYVEAITNYFTELHCTVNILYLIDQQITFETMRDIILSADIIYVGGGNTLKMMTLWRRLGIDILVDQARQQGAVLCGISAGSICWFKYGNSDSRKFKNPAADYIKVTALGFIDAFNCPHYDTEVDRKASLKKMMKNYPGVAIAVDDCAALEIVDDRYRIISSNNKAQAYKVYWKDGTFYEEVIERTDNFKLLSTLLSK